MAVTSVHPLYMKFSPLWRKMLDCFQGADHIKEQGTLYLRPTASMRYDGMNPDEPGFQAYEDYKFRARFPEYVNDAVLNHGGLLHNKEAQITLPDGMSMMLERASSKGESLFALLRRINELQLRDGRLGLMLELPAEGSTSAVPYISVYEALTLRNWDDGTDELGHVSLNMVTLDESGYVRNQNGFDWNWEERYRVLSLGRLDTDEPEGSATYNQWVTTVTTEGEGDNASKVETTEDVITPVYQGTPLNKIPFVFCNAMDLASEPDRPPLLTLANAAIAIYNSEADYRQGLYMQSQDTLVVRGGIQNNTSLDDKEPLRVGAGARIDVNETGDAKYIGVNSQGLPEQRKALEADHTDAAARSGQLTRTDTASQESGEALRTRLVSKTASLVGIALTGAAALQEILRICAEWMGLNPDEVKVLPNLDFSKTVMVGQDFVQIMTAKGINGPITMESIHAWLVDKGMTSKSFEDEMNAIQQEYEKWPFLKPVDPKADQNGIQQQDKKPPTQS